MCWVGNEGAGVDASHYRPFLQANCPSTRQSFVDTRRLYYTPQKNSDVRWNWEKFLITKSGKPFKRYDPGTTPEEISKDITFLLQQRA